MIRSIQNWLEFLLGSYELTGFQKKIFVGWDVGGWNCEKNPNSRDALAILDSSGEQIGDVWRGNLRDSINNSATSADFILALMEKCHVGSRTGEAIATMAIDAPLGFPDHLTKLITLQETRLQTGVSADNTYLFRRTERRLFEENIAPLSAIKDMIGSQSTKAMHVVAKFAPNRVATGIWSDNSNVTIIETYPALCRMREPMLSESYSAAGDKEIGDIADARICANVAYLFQCNRERLESPDPETPPLEGWIWAPKRKSFKSKANR